MSKDISALERVISLLPPSSVAAKAVTPDALPSTIAAVITTDNDLFNVFPFMFFLPIIVKLVLRHTLLRNFLRKTKTMSNRW